MAKILITNRQKAVKLNLRKLGKELNTSLRLLGLEKAELSLLFTGSRRMLSLNTKFRGIAKVTDVISFPLDDPPGEKGEILLGDIAVCIPQTVRQAREYGVSFDNELRRLLIHGLLHLIGYDHEKSDIMRKKMEKKELELLRALASVD